MDLQALPFDSYRIWFRMNGLPPLHQSETDICYILQGYLPVNSLKPRKNQIVPPEGFKVRTTLPTTKRVPTRINIEDDDGVHFIEFTFLKLPPQFCMRCQKLGHQLESCLGTYNSADDIALILPSQPLPQVSAHHLLHHSSMAQSCPRSTHAESTIVPPRIVLLVEPHRSTPLQPRHLIISASNSGPTDSVTLPRVGPSIIPTDVPLPRADNPVPQ